jgi:hypothetical protein
MSRAGGKSAKFLLILAGALAIAAAGCGSSATTPTPAASAIESATPAATVPATPLATPTPAPTVAPTPTPTPIVGAWKPVADSATLKKIQFYKVAWTGSRFAAGGVATDGSAVFLDSTDGLTWNLQPTVWKDATIRGLASGPGGLVAVGERSGRMASWTSTDGLSWVLAPDATSMHPAKGHSFIVSDVAPASGGWMAVGEEIPTCMTGPCAPVRAVVWASADGVAWTQAPAAAPLAKAAMTGIVQWHGTFVAVGRAGKYAAVWTSSDGTAWTRVPDSAAFHAPKGTDQEIGASMTAIAGGSDRLVAVGQVFSQGSVSSALGWWSSDSAKWTGAKGEKFLFGQIFDLAAVPTGYLAVGPCGSPSCLGGIWSSTDGAAWKCEASAAGFKGFAPYDVASSPTIEVVVGFGRPSGAATGAVWTRTLTAP